MNWKTILATALITGFVTVITGMILSWWQKDKSQLTYNSIQSIPFDDATNSLYIQQIEITNSGDKPVEDIVFIANFTDDVIQKSRVTIDKAITYTEDKNAKTIQLKITNLNPTEGANISILYQSTTSDSKGAKISLRGKGVTGKSIGSNKDNLGIPIGISVLAAYAGIFAFLLSTKRGRAMLPVIVKNIMLGRSIGSDQKNHIASALSMYGYTEKAKEYLNSSTRRMYWVEADLLAAEAISGDEKLKNDTIEILLLISKIPNIVPSSKAIIYYNIAKLYKVIATDSDKYDKYINLAKGLDKDEIEDRMSRDPVFL